MPNADDKRIRRCLHVRNVARAIDATMCPRWQRPRAGPVDLAHGGGVKYMPAKMVYVRLKLIDPRAIIMLRLRQIS